MLIAASSADERCSGSKSSTDCCQIGSRFSAPQDRLHVQGTASEHFLAIQLNPSFPRRRTAVRNIFVDFQTVISGIARNDFRRRRTCMQALHAACAAQRNWIPARGGAEPRNDVGNENLSMLLRFLTAALLQICAVTMSSRLFRTAARAGGNPWHLCSESAWVAGCVGTTAWEGAALGFDRAPIVERRLHFRPEPAIVHGGLFDRSELELNC